ncbi:hypothetical protein [uncultured Desulfovibrio sp.]|uniref:hypothetical protein n=1 Tax=uncultured Desulfovibrio sp. TaxID=167968 RepID=UPI0026363630|nr:hypothetical protein [uncultured Desulfovibrio sp.]
MRLVLGGLLPVRLDVIHNQPMLDEDNAIAERNQKRFLNQIHQIAMARANRLPNKLRIRAEAIVVGLHADVKIEGLR